MIKGERGGISVLLAFFHTIMSMIVDRSWTTENIISLPFISIVALFVSWLFSHHLCIPHISSTDKKKSFKNDFLIILQTSISRCLIYWRFLFVLIFQVLFVARLCFKVWHSTNYKCQKQMSWRFHTVLKNNVESFLYISRTHKHKKNQLFLIFFINKKQKAQKNILNSIWKGIISSIR